MTTNDLEKWFEAKFKDLKPNPPKRFLTVKEAAEFLTLSVPTLALYRQNGTGPIYSALGGRIVYDVNDLEEYVVSRKVQLGSMTDG